MGRGARIANRVRENYFLKEKISLSVLEDLCFSESALVKYETISGAQGRIMFARNSDKSIITINDQIDYQPKKKFVLAHEFGHRSLHFKVMNFICDDYDLQKWDSDDRYENEANDFASELLMPQYLLKKLSSGRNLSSELIKELAQEFGTSLTSTAIQYAKYGQEPCYIVMSTGGRVSWVSKSSDINLGFIERGKRVPKSSNAGIYFNKNKKPEKEVCIARDWFEDIKKDDLYLYEDNIYLDNYSSVISFLWICSKYD